MAGSDSAGGSAGLAELIDSHGECIVADLQDTYGVNLVSALQSGSGYSPRQLLVLIKQLPSDSRTHAALRGGDEFVGWGIDRYILATIVDAINHNTHAIVAANSGKKKPRAPKPHYRPDAAKKRKQSNPFFQQLNKAKQAKEAVVVEPGN